jgi:hypothetical protein
MTCACHAENQWATADLLLLLPHLLQDSRITIDGIIRHPWFNKRLPQK